jgi:hypothetical protein
LGRYPKTGFAGSVRLMPAPLLERFSPPENGTLDQRLEWAGNEVWNLAEGNIDRQSAGLLWAIVVGWCDLASEDERRQYAAVARSIAELQQQLLESE